MKKKKRKATYSTRPITLYFHNNSSIDVKKFHFLFSFTQNNFNRD